MNVLQLIGMPRWRRGPDPNIHWILEVEFNVELLAAADDCMSSECSVPPYNGWASIWLSRSALGSPLFTPFKVSRGIESLGFTTILVRIWSHDELKLIKSLSHSGDLLILHWNTNSFSTLFIVARLFLLELNHVLTCWLRSNHIFTTATWVVEEFTHYLFNVGDTSDSSERG